MVLPLIQMVTISRLTGKNSKASQWGLTTPTLHESGLDFSNRGRKTRKRRQVRISCIFVAHYFCARVKSRIVTNSVYHCIPLYPLVAYHRIPSYTPAYHRIPLHTIAYRCIQSYISISTYKNINIYKYSNINICGYTNVPPPVENDPTDGK